MLAAPIPSALLGDFRVLDQRRREAITQAEQLKARRNELSQQVGARKKAGQDATAVMEETRALKDRLDELDKTAATLDEQMRLSLAGIPNLTRDEVPIGTSEADNVTVKTWGEKPHFDFAPKPHWELGEAARHPRPRTRRQAQRRALRRLHGRRRAARTRPHQLHARHCTPRSTATPKSCRPSWSTAKACSAPASCPSSPKTSSAAPMPTLKPSPAASSRTTTTGSFPPPRSPSPISIATKSSTKPACPSRLTAYTPCFRAEAGAAGKDTRGIIRQHQFQKVELVKFTRPEESDAEHERLTRDAEEILEALNLPYRRVLLCTGDTGFSSAKTYDLEVWLPGQQLYREISSCSNFEAFQARRANIRYKPAARAPRQKRIRAHAQRQRSGCGTYLARDS